ncbi:MAG TPA: carboxymuconolactone decarboxylase family protein [Azospirillum sp.]|nr:carboxymuconolactone decarboxylase family protein [Azospirillum sp.]
MTKNWPERLAELKGAVATLRGGHPEVMKHFGALSAAAIETGALDGRTKELIALAVAVAARCEGCIAAHAEAALRHGASRAAVLEAMGVAVWMAAGPGVMYAAQALQAYDQFAEQGTAT